MKWVLNRLIWMMGMVGIIWVMPLAFERVAHDLQWVDRQVKNGCIGSEPDTSVKKAPGAVAE